jgi:hypothetical protein
MRSYFLTKGLPMPEEPACQLKESATNAVPYKFTDRQSFNGRH